MADEGRVILFSSHILEEVERLAQNVLVIVSGRLAASGDFREIRRLMTDRPHTFTMRSSDDRRLAAALVGHPSVFGVQLDDGRLAVRTSDYAGFARALPVLARAGGVSILELASDRRGPRERLRLPGAAMSGPTPGPVDARRPGGPGRDRSRLGHRHDRRADRAQPPRPPAEPAPRPPGPAPRRRGHPRPAVRPGRDRRRGGGDRDHGPADRHDPAADRGARLRHRRPRRRAGGRDRGLPPGQADRPLADRGRQADRRRRPVDRPGRAGVVHRRGHPPAGRHRAVRGDRAPPSGRRSARPSMRPSSSPSAWSPGGRWRSASSTSSSGRASWPGCSKGSGP